MMAWPVSEPFGSAFDPPGLPAYFLFSFVNSHMFPFLFLFLLDALNPPYLHFDLQASILTSVMYPQFRTLSLTSYIVADTVGTPQLDL